MCATMPSWALPHHKNGIGFAWILGMLAMNYGGWVLLYPNPVNVYIEVLSHMCLELITCIEEWRSLLFMFRIGNLMIDTNSHRGGRFPIFSSMKDPIIAKRQFRISLPLLLNIWTFNSIECQRVCWSQYGYVSGSRIKTATYSCCSWIACWRQPAWVGAILGNHCTLLCLMMIPNVLLWRWNNDWVAKSTTTQKNSSAYPINLWKVIATTNLMGSNYG